MNLLHPTCRPLMLAHHGLPGRHRRFLRSCSTGQQAVDASADHFEKHHGR